MNPSHSFSKDLKNFALAILVSVPAIIFHNFFIHHSLLLKSNYSIQNVSPILFNFEDGARRVIPEPLMVQMIENKEPLSNYIFMFGLLHPLWTVVILFFINVNLLFWIISLIQQSTWLIDPYWTIIPLFIEHFYATHPLSCANLHRSKIVKYLVWIWSVRLSHSYFRRENWRWGWREDWRFQNLKQQYKCNWWWISFFLVYVSQEVFLIGVCLPVYIVHFHSFPLSYMDIFATIICLVGIVISYFADTQLHNFVSSKSKSKSKSKHTNVILDTGLWKYSRHPNYVGEQLWWWGLCFFGFGGHYYWIILGTFINSLCLAYVTVLVERRMLSRVDRADAYLWYQKSTSAWVPLPKWKKLKYI